MTNSIGEIEDAKFLFIIGSNTTEAHPVISYYMKRAKKKGARIFVSDPRRVDISLWADKYIQIKPGTDVAYINGLIREIVANGWHAKEYIENNTEGFDEMMKTVDSYTLERTSEITGVPVDMLKDVARELGTFGDTISLVYTLGITEHVHGVDNVRSTANLQMVLGNVGKYAGGVNPLRGQNNVQGACDMGALPNVYQSYQKVNDPKAHEKFEKAWGTDLDDKIGMTIPEMFDGIMEDVVKSLYVYGENIVMSEPNMAHTKKILEKCEFVVVGEIFYNETCPYADVIFPDTSWAEEDGTFTNTERRVQRVRKVIEPQGEARSHWWVLGELAKRMGYDMSYEKAEDIWEEIRTLGPAYCGITYDRIDDIGLQWPCTDSCHIGTPFLHKDGCFVCGKGKFVALEHRGPAELVNDEYPLWLSTGRRLWHYHTVQTHHCKGIHELCGEEWLEMSPEDSEQLGVKNGDWIKATTRRGSIELRAWVTERSPKGIVWTSFHFADACGNVLTNDVCDPISKTWEYKACAVKVEKLRDGEPMGSDKVRRRQARP